jgi:addiction module HigA family antidote
MKMIRVPTHRAPTHPGEMLLEEFLIPMGLSQRQLAQAIHVPYQRVNELVNGRRGVTPGTALRLAKFFGVSADFWMNLQLRWDLSRTAERVQVSGDDSALHGFGWLCGIRGDRTGGEDAPDQDGDEAGFGFHSLRFQVHAPD